MRKPDLAPGGWAFEFENDLYPDVDDTAVVALALRAASAATRPSSAASPGSAGMQSRSGGWGAFDADNEALWLYKLPFCDFGKVTDEPSADVTAHALEALAPEGGYDDEVAPRARLAARASRRRDGSWFGRWGVNHVYGTGAALPALEACGIAAGHPAFGGQSPGSTRCRTPTAASARTSAPTPTRRGAAAGSHSFPNSLGAISLRRRRRGGQPPSEARRRVALQRTTTKW